MWVAILFAAGLVLILAEFLIPGLVAGTIGTGLIIASAVMAFMYHPDYALLIVLAELVLVAFGVSAGMMLMSRTTLGRQLMLETSQRASAGWVAAETDESLKDAEGTVATALRPAGTISINGKRIDAVSDGTFIEEGAHVRVIETHGSRVVVERK